MTTSMHDKLFCATILLALLPSATRAGEEGEIPTNTPSIAEAGYANTQANLTPLIRKAMKQRKIVGLSIALVDDQTVVWSQGFGYADKAHKIEAGPETIYRTGSLSKLFNATAAMQLNEQGKLDIDQPIQTHVPNFSIKTRFPQAEPITPRHIMTHHSGLPADYLKGASGGDSLSQLVEKLADEYTAYPPNLIFSYSNLAVALLGNAIENTCGKPYADCLQERVLRPLGMEHSEFSTDVSSALASSKAYRNGRETEQLPIRDIPAGGLNSNVLDLSRFVRMVFAGGHADGQAVLTRESLTEMLRPQNTNVALDLDQRIGLPWFIDQTPSGQVAYHDGTTGLFNSILMVSPEQKLGVVLLSNSAESNGLVYELASAALQLMLREKTGGTAATSADKPIPALATLAVEGYPGYYASAAGLLKIWKQKGHLRLSINGQSFALKQGAKGTLVAKLPGTGKIALTRAELSERQVLIGTLDGNPAGRQLLGEQISPQPIASGWLQRQGLYRVINPDAGMPFDRIRVLVKDGFLLARVNPAGTAQPDIRVLTPVSDTEAVIAGLGRGLGETLTAEFRDGEEILRYSGYLLRPEAR